MKIEVNTRLKSKYTGKICTVTEVNIKWDWFAVEWDRPTKGCKRIHDNIDAAHLYFTEVAPTTTDQITRADTFLRRANGGLDDSWREYD